MYGSTGVERYHECSDPSLAQNGVDYHKDNQDPRDPLDLRIGRVVESTEIFAERNLLSDASSALPPATATPVGSGVRRLSGDQPLTPAATSVTLQRRDHQRSGGSNGESFNSPEGQRRLSYDYVQGSARDLQSVGRGRSPSPTSPVMNSDYRPPNRGYATSEAERLNNFPHDYYRGENRGERAVDGGREDHNGEYGAHRRVASPLPPTHRLLSARNLDQHRDLDAEGPSSSPTDRRGYFSDRMPERLKRHKGPSYLPYPNVRLSPVQDPTRSPRYDASPNSLMRQRRLTSVDGHYDEKMWRYSGRSETTLDPVTSLTPPLLSPATFSRIDSAGSSSVPNYGGGEEVYDRGPPNSNHVKRELDLSPSSLHAFGQHNVYRGYGNGPDSKVFQVQKRSIGSSQPSQAGDISLRLKQESTTPPPQRRLTEITNNRSSMAVYPDDKKPVSPFEISPEMEGIREYLEPAAGLGGFRDYVSSSESKEKRSDFLDRVLQEKLSKQGKSGEQKSSNAAAMAAAALLPLDSSDVESRLRAADQAARMHNLEDDEVNARRMTPSHFHAQRLSRFSSSTTGAFPGGGGQSFDRDHPAIISYHPRPLERVDGGGSGSFPRFPRPEFSPRMEHPERLGGPGAMSRIDTPETVLKRFIHFQKSRNMLTEAMAAQMNMVRGPSPPSYLQRSQVSPSELDSSDPNDRLGGPGSVGSGSEGAGSKGKRGRPRKHAPKIPLPPLYVFIRNMLHNRSYNPKIVSWVNEPMGVFKVNNTSEFARTWGHMKSNRSEEMNYEKMSRAMRYHYGSEKQGRKGHLAMVKEKRLVYRFGELAVNWRSSEVRLKDCHLHDLCKGCLCLWTKE